MRHTGMVADPENIKQQEYSMPQMMVTTVTLSDGTTFSWTIGPLSKRWPLLRRDGYFAGISSDAEQYELNMLLRKICVLRAQSREYVSPREEDHCREIELVINTKTTAPPDWDIIVLSSYDDVDFDHYRDCIDRRIKAFLREPVLPA